VREISDLIRAWSSLPPGAPAILATVVHTGGSTYRKAGARMLLSQGGWLAGSISGGCLEGDLLATAWDRTAVGPVLATYDATSNDDIVWGFGLGCNGLVEVLIERIGADGGVLKKLSRAKAERSPLMIATSLSESLGIGTRWYLWPKGVQPEDLPLQLKGLMLEAGADQNQTVEIDGIRFYIESHVAPRELFVFGAGHDAAPLVLLANSLGWRVTVADHRETYANADRFPDADDIIVCAADEVGSRLRLGPGDAAIVMSHHYLNDRTTLGYLLDTGAAYIGVLGPARRTDRMLVELGAERSERLHSPVGLDIGAEGPHEIALAIMAEVQAFLNGRTGVSLGDPQARKISAGGGFGK